MPVNHFQGSEGKFQEAALLRRVGGRVHFPKQRDDRILKNGADCIGEGGS